MNLQDVFWLSYKDLAEKRVRTALTVVMVVIGVASIVALISLTQGISASIASDLASLGPTSIIVISSNPASGFTPADIQRLQSLPDTLVAIPIITGSVSVLANNQNVSATLIGVSPQGLQQLLGGTVKMDQGSLYQDTIAPSSLLGHSVAFPTSTGAQSMFVGQPVNLKISGRGGGSYTVPVVGILQSYGSSIVDADGSITTSLAAAEALLHKTYFN
ncbi:MAG: ABC transporter permease, partial [Candidatus Micrarchaeales archaeon]